jgi:hypothetical protein
MRTSGVGLYFLRDSYFIALSSCPCADRVFGGVWRAIVEGQRSSALGSRAYHELDHVQKYGFASRAGMPRMCYCSTVFGSVRQDVRNHVELTVQALVAAMRKLCEINA